MPTIASCGAGGSCLGVTRAPGPEVGRAGPLAAGLASPAGVDDVEDHEDEQADCGDDTESFENGGWWEGAGLVSHWVRMRSCLRDA